MPQAAVPAYVGQDFGQCPPGHRFHLYLPLWTACWEADRDDARAAALRALREPLPQAVAGLLAALDGRQQRLAQSLPPGRCLVLETWSVAPFATGLGAAHPLDNGFAFLSPYGLPYLAGSGVKGVFRRAAEELVAAGEPGFEPDVPALLFGTPQPGGAGGGRGALSCWDVLPRFDAMALEVMTPHQGSYLAGHESPHDAGQPRPIRFLALPPGTRFRFVLVLDAPAVPALAPWRRLARRVAAHAFEWLGLGAKTSMGYGAMAGVDVDVDVDFP